MLQKTISRFSLIMMTTLMLAVSGCSTLSTTEPSGSISDKATSTLSSALEMKLTYKNAAAQWKTFRTNFDPATISVKNRTAVITAFASIDSAFASVHSITHAGDDLKVRAVTLAKFPIVAMEGKTAINQLRTLYILNKETISPEKAKVYETLLSNGDKIVNLSSDRIGTNEKVIKWLQLFDLATKVL